MKQIIQRKLPLNVHYVLTDKKYIPVAESIGICCDNCGQLIANIATVKNSNGNVYTIGFDCLETILINNSLLSANDIEEYERVKLMIPKILRFSKKIKEIIAANKHINITGIKFDKQQGEFFPFYWLKNNETNSRDNDYIKLKEVDFCFLLTTIQNIFPHLNITKCEQ